MTDDVLKKIKDLISSKMPLMSKDKVESMAGSCISGIREYLKDLKKFNTQIEFLTGNPSFRFRVDTFIAAVRKDQGEMSQSAPKHSDFDKYKIALVYTTFPLKGASIGTGYVKNEIEKYSCSLANHQLIEYYTPEGIKMNRNLTQDEYEEVSRLRRAAGKGGLRPYSEMKYKDENLQEFDITKVTEPVAEKANASHWYDDNDLEPEEPNF